SSSTNPRRRQRVDGDRPPEDIASTHVARGVRTGAPVCALRPLRRRRAERSRVLAELRLLAGRLSELRRGRAPGTIGARSVTLLLAVVGVIVADAATPADA